MILNKIKDIKIPLKAVLGETEISLDDLSKLGKGSVIELNSLVNSPVLLESNDKVIAKGEVVVIEEKFGIRITKILSKKE